MVFYLNSISVMLVEKLGSENAIFIWNINLRRSLTDYVYTYQIQPSDLYNFDELSFLEG